MDLMSAKVDAASASRKHGKTVYVNVDKEGECVISDTADKSTQAIFANGKEVKEGNVAAPIKSTTTSQNKTKMAETIEGAKPAAKAPAAKKAVAKPAAKKPEAKKAAKKPAGKLEPIGVTMQFTPEQANKFRAKLNKADQSAREFVTSVVLKAL